MAEPAAKRCALAAWSERLVAVASRTGGSLRLRQVSFLAQLDLRGNPADPAFLAGVRSAVGLGLPLEPNSTAESNGLTALWLGPDQWHLVGPEGGERSLEERLLERLAGRHASVVDVSAGRTVIEMGGAKARQVLAKGCSLDLHPRAFSKGRCAQTQLARAQVILHQRAEDPVYWLYLRPSFAPYLADWLLDAIAEYARQADG